MRLIAARRFPIFRLLLAIVIGGMWIRSHFHSDILTIFLHRGTAQGLMSDRGKAVLFLTNIRHGTTRAYTVDHLAMPNDEFAILRARLYETPPLPLKFIGLHIGSSGADAFGIPQARYYFLIVPLWMLTAITGAPLMIGLNTFWHRRKWGTPGICGNCGYDLRATPARCPECGCAVA